MTGASTSIRPADRTGVRNTARMLRAVRAIRRARAEGSSRGDVVYAVYAGVMVAAIVGVPIVRAVVLYLAEPAASAVLVDVGPTVSGTVFALACAAFVALGGVRGPALLSPFLVFAVAGGGHPRRRTLLRPVVRSVLALAVAGAGIALLPALVVAGVGDATVGGALAFAGAGALVGVACGGCWLLGQRVTAAVRAWIVVGEVATWVVWVTVPASAGVLPWGWFAALFPEGGGPAPGWGAVDWGALGGALAGLGALAVAAVAVTPALLDGLRGPALLSQAQRWQTAGMFAFTGDLAMAMGEFRAVPRRGRGLAAIGGGGLALMFARRDLVGSLRTPARFALACAGCLGFGLLITVAVGASGPGVWIAAGAAAIVGFLALGVWSDGFRHVAEVASAPPLYGVSTPRLLGLHAALPVVAGVVFSGVGVGVGGVVLGGIGAGAELVWPALVAAVLCVLLLVLVRVYDSAKGPLPLALMAPVPTPAGDASALVVALWQADAVILAGVVVGVTVNSTAAIGWLGSAIAIPLCGVLALLARGRIGGH